MYFMAFNFSNLDLCFYYLKRVDSQLYSSETEIASASSSNDMAHFEVSHYTEEEGTEQVPEK